MCTQWPHHCTLYSVQCTYLYALEPTFSEYSNYTIYMCLRTIHSRSTEPVQCTVHVELTFQLSVILIRHMYTVQVAKV